MYFFVLSEQVTKKTGKLKKKKKETENFNSEKGNDLKWKEREAENMSESVSWSVILKDTFNFLQNIKWKTVFLVCTTELHHL